MANELQAEIIGKFNDFVRKKGLRRTSQRDSIIHTVFEKDDHFTAEELFERVRRKDASTSRATVYRTINLLEEADLLHEIDLGGSEKTYDPNFHNRPSHNHLICIDCDKVIEFEDTHIEVLNDCITRRLGFIPSKQSLRIEACCEALRSTGRCENLIKARMSGKKIKRK